MTLKMYIRLHFDYCDTIYDGHITIQDATRLETLQNRSARLTTGALFRTSSDNIRRELGWEKLKTRKHIHRLTFYHKLSTTEDNDTPRYITYIMPQTRAHDTDRTLRNANHHTQAQIRTTTHQRSFFPLTGNQWNQLPTSTKKLPLLEFKRSITHQLGTPKPPLYYTLGDKTSNIMHTRLRIRMSLLNAHMFKIQKSDSPSCSCGYLLEDTNHYIFSCPKYTHQRDTLFNNISIILQYDFTQVPRSIQSQILLHGSDLGASDVRPVARHFQNFLHSSHRFTSGG